MLKMKTAAVAVFILFVWNSSIILVQSDLDSYFQDGNPSDPMGAFAAETYNLGQLKCRKGYYNLSDQFVDAIYHCAGIKHEQEGQVQLSDETVKFDGPSPFLCYRTCVVNEAGLLNDDLHGVNETRLFKVMKQQFHKAGGIESSYKLTKELMECSKKHPTVFPKQYINCTGTEDFFRCTGHVLANCETQKETLNQMYYAKAQSIQAAEAL